MPITCFSYPGDVPPGAGNGGASERPVPGMRQMPFTCYGYPLSCFSYPDDAPSPAGKRDVIPTAPPGLRQLPIGTCFRY